MSSGKAGATGAGSGPRVVYVAGTGYSGSTLLAFLLNAHPELASVGEPTGPYAGWDDQARYRCSCGSELADCAFWQRISKEMRSRGFEFGPNRWKLAFDLGRSAGARQLLSRSLRSNALDDLRDALVLRVPAWRRELEEIARRNEAFVASVLAVTGKRVFVDATKDPVQARYLLSRTNLDLHVIHLVRDAPGFVSSFIPNAGGTLDGGVRYWNRTVGHVRRLAARLPEDRFLRVRYEDLCTRTEQELARIAGFAGVTPRPGPVDFRSSEHHVLGNRMRMESSSEIALDERWRERLRPDELRAILRRTARRRALCGYA
jgi:hypothetical protein